MIRSALQQIVTNIKLYLLFTQHYSMILSVFTFLESNWLLISMFFLVSIVYASVGFGGGSSYLALLTLFGFAFPQLRTTALLCNVVVVSGNVFFYYQQNQYQLKQIVPLLILSVPCAFLGGFLKISAPFFYILLGFTLLTSSVMTWYSSNKNKKYLKNNTNKYPVKASLCGGIIGFVSGMVGIGGGIFLAPILYITNWNTPKKIAAAASLYILINSISGVIGHYFNSTFQVQWNKIIVFMFVVMVGGVIGNKMSNRFLKHQYIQKVTAGLIALVGLRILFNSFF